MLQASKTNTHQLLFTEAQAPTFLPQSADAHALQLVKCVHD